MGWFSSSPSNGNAINVVRNAVASGAKKVVAVAAQIKETGVFDGIPIVSNIIAGAGAIQEMIENKDDSDDTLNEASDYMGLVAVTLLTISKVPGVQSMANVAQNLNAVEKCMQVIEADVVSHQKKLLVQKVLSSDVEDFKEHLDALKAVLEALHFAVTGA
jgi:hypothetical protein